MQLLAHRGLPSLLAVLALFSYGAAATAADLVLESRIVSEEDLIRVVPTAEAGLGIHRQGSIDLVHASGDVEALARSSESQTAHLGDGAEYYGICAHRAGAADFTPTARFELRDRHGTLVWKTGATEDVSYAISRNGVVVGMSLNINVPDRNRLHFYGDAGQLLAEVALPHLIGGEFTADGNHFFAVSAVAGLVAFDSGGSEIYRVSGARLFAATPDGSHLAAIGDGVLRMVQNGRTTASTSIEGLLVRRIAIAPDGSRVAIAMKHELRVYGATGLDLLLSIPLEDSAFSWTSVDLGSDNGWLVAGTARDLGPAYGPLDRHPDGEVRAYDAQGRLAHKVGLEFPVWNIWSPTTILDADGSGLTVTTRRAVYRTVLP